MCKFFETLILKAPKVLDLGGMVGNIIGDFDAVLSDAFSQFSICIVA